jgi:hypothetical protein
MFLIIITKKGSLIPKVCFSSPGQAIKMVDTCVLKVNNQRE